MNKKSILIIFLFIVLSLLLSGSTKATDIHHDLIDVEVRVNGKKTTYNYGQNQENYEMKLSNIDFDYGNNSYTGHISFVRDEEEKEELTKITEYDEDSNKLQLKLNYKLTITNDTEADREVNDLKYYCDAEIDSLEIDDPQISIQESQIIGGYKVYSLTSVSIGAGDEKTFYITLLMDSNSSDDEIKRKNYKTWAETGSTSSSSIKFRLAQSLDNRTISGYVFDDSEKVDEAYVFADGKDDSHPRISDVIVQLIEVKNNTYYIWKEVKTNADGKYKFNNILPGNYIVRFIYGYGPTSRIGKYNGHDYKSTTDVYYEQYKEGKLYNDYYSSAEIENASVARDNEARRLDVIAKTAVIDKGLSNQLEENTDYKNTCMYADTSIINIPVATENGNETSDDNIVSGTASYHNFSAVNFGLEERPKTKITLEKHITGLIIGNSLEAHVNENEDNTETVSFLPNSKMPNGILTAKYSTREENGRAEWNVMLDNEAWTGSYLSLEYKYTVKNESETDYIHEDLADAFDFAVTNDSNWTSYTTMLRNKAGAIREIIKDNGYNNELGERIGSTYYTANENVPNVREVVTHIGYIADKIDNKFDLKDPDGTASFIEDDDNKIKTRYRVGKLEPAGGTYTTKISLTDDNIAASGGIDNILKYIGYIAQINSAYRNPMGRRDIISIPENFNEDHNEEGNVKFKLRGELDEFWGETVVIREP